MSFNYKLVAAEASAANHLNSKSLMKERRRAAWIFGRDMAPGIYGWDPQELGFDNAQDGG
jgi:hypothetical protein